MTPEQISREAAEALVRFRNPHDSSHDFGDGNQWAQLVVAGQHVHSDWYTAGQRERLRGSFRDVILAAIRRALATAPVPSPIGEARLAQINDAVRLIANVAAVPSSEDAPLAQEVLLLLRDLLAHVDHLTRALADCGADGSAAVWSAGYEAGRQLLADAYRRGAEAQRKADALAILHNWPGKQWEHASVDEARDAMLAAPLATPEGV